MIAPVRLLSQLPLDFLRMVVLDFLEVRDLARLCCVDRYAGSIMVGHLLKEECQHMTNEFLLWLKIKNIFVQSVVLMKPLDECVLEDANCFSAVQSVRIQNGFTTTQVGMRSIFTKCRELRRLYIADSEDCNDGVVETIGTYCDKIDDLTLWSVPSLSLDGLRFLAERLPLLRKLTLGSYDELGDESKVLVFCECCADLESLNLTCCSYLSDVTLRAIAQGCSRLKQLKIGGNKSTFSSSAMCEMFQSLPLLTSFAFPISMHSSLDSSCVVQLSQSCLLLQCVDTGDIDVDDEAVCALARNCSHLKELSIYGASITDASVTVLANLRPQLKKIIIGYSALLTDLSLFAIAEGCPLLCSLRTNNCAALTDAGYTAIAQHCLELTDISLSCRATDATLLQLASHSAHLTCVWCHSSSCFSDSALAALVTGCKDLALVDMKSCGGVTPAGVASARALNADLHIRI